MEKNINPQIVRYLCNMVPKAIFQRPAIPLISAMGLNAVDMHYHTCHSDTTTKVKDAIRMAAKKGIGVAITDHNEIKGSLEALRQKGSVMVIPGIEISTSDGPHVLIYFYTKGDMVDFYNTHLKKKKSISPYMLVNITTGELVEKARGYSCLVSAAHPYGYLLFNKGLQKCIDKKYLDAGISRGFHAVEAICGSMVRRVNEKAVNLAGSLEKGMTGGSDGHMLMDLGNVVTCTDADSIGGFLDRIRRRQSIVVGKEKRRLGKLMQATKMMTAYAKYTGPSLRVHYEVNLPRLKRLPDRLKNGFMSRMNGPLKGAGQGSAGRESGQSLNQK